MQAATHQEMKEFISGHSSVRCDDRKIAFDFAEAKSIRVELKVNEPSQLIYLARLVAHLRYEEAHFTSAALWITQWGIWDDRVEAVGLKTIERFRQGFGENRSLQVAPGLLFRHDEFVESVSCLLQPMLVGWDAYYVPRWAWGSLDFFLFVSHDGFLDINTRTTEMYNEALVILGKEWTKNGMRS